MENTPYKISETFLSFQGEGEHSGKSAFFVRLFGCNVRCPWCDTKYAWLSGEGCAVRPAGDIAREAAASGAGIAVVTGGEPCLQYLPPLVESLKKVGLRVHLETSGVCPIDEKNGECAFDWVALSPKLFREPLPESLARADEIKAIVSSSAELREYESRFFSAAKRAKSIWITPEWGKVKDLALLGDISNFVVSAKDRRVRAGWQLHKNYFAR